MRRCGRLGLMLLLAIPILSAAVYVLRIQVLTSLGEFLVHDDAPARGDVIVAIRGDEVYFHRALTAARLFESGFAPYVYVSSALEDTATLPLRERGIQLPSARDNIVAVLRDAGVPCERILLDDSPPGGGSEGEIARIRAMLLARGFSSAILVTSWYHSRRVRAHAFAALKDTGRSALVVRSIEPTSATNWWTHRYVGIAVIEAYAKLTIELLPFGLSFADDPAQPRTVAVAPQCEAPAR